MADDVELGQNPHDVEQWRKRAELFTDDLTKQILTYSQALKTIDPMKAVGKPHTLWVAFAKLYENQKDIANARVIFNKAVQVDFKGVDNLASLWCEWADMELRSKNFKEALALMKRATAEPSIEVADRKEPVQVKLHRSRKLWTCYLDLEESLGSLESTRAVYERILDLKLATPQIIVNYAMLLEEHKHFDDAFRVYERGLKIFKHPHVKDIWTTYLATYVKRFGSSKLECARDLFERAIQMAPAESVKPLSLQYAKFEEDHGLAKRAMKIYGESIKAVPTHEKMSMYKIYIARVSEIYGVPKSREIYEQAIEESSGLAEKDVTIMCMKYAELEKSLGEIDRARGIYVYAASSQFAVADPDIWKRWREFEVAHGNQDTFREYLRIRRSFQKEDSKKCDNSQNTDDGDEIGKVLEKHLVEQAEVKVEKKAAIEEEKEGVVPSVLQAEEIGIDSEISFDCCPGEDSSQLPQEEYGNNTGIVVEKDAPSAAACGSFVRKRKDQLEEEEGGGNQIVPRAAGGGSTISIKRMRLY